MDIDMLMYAHECGFVHVYVYAYIHMYVCMQVCYMCICVHRYMSAFI